MAGEELFAVVFVIGMFAGVFIVYMGLRQRSQQIEMQHRERMAMIERGQIPLSEPASVRHSVERQPVYHDVPSNRAMSVGIIVVGLGIALMTIISIAGESPEVGVGVGGAIAVLGGAFIVRSLLVRPETLTPRQEYRQGTPLSRQDAPPPPPPLDDRNL
jgi:hypothetical protein